MLTALAGNWLPHLLQAVWQNTIAGVLVLLILRMLPRATPQFRHALVCIALLKFAIPPMLPLPTGIFSAAPPAPAISPVRDTVIASMTNMPSLVIALMLIHLGGTCFFLARLAIEALQLRGIRRRAIALNVGPASAGRSIDDGPAEAGPTLLISTEITVPMTTGRAILIPHQLVNILTTSQLADVLCHEREHVRRRDVLLNWLQELVVALWWFHPLVHMLGKEARTLREECCDDALLASGTCDTAHYARTLLHAATFATRTPVAAAAIVESQDALLRRVRRIADVRFAPSRRMNFATIALIVILALTLLPGLRISAANRFAFDHATFAAIHHHHQH